MSRDDYFEPALANTSAMALAAEDWNAAVLRREAEESIARGHAVRMLADAYLASNRSTMRVMHASVWAVIERMHTEAGHAGLSFDCQLSWCGDLRTALRGRAGRA